MRRIPFALLASVVVAGFAPDSPRSFVPVFATDFPDPFILPHHGGYLAYATNAKGLQANVQMAASADLRSWQLVKDGDRLHDALPSLPRWAAAGRTWAPEVLKVGSRYLLYFTAAERATGLQCVGVASAADPGDAFVSAADAPLVCQRDQGGTIDPSPFRDADGSLYLLFKSDGNNPAFLKPSRIYVQPLAADGLSLMGAPQELIRNDQKWEWRVVESPTMLRDPEGRYVLLFSANHFGWETDQRLSNYAIGYARCATVTGPCVKASENPILMSYWSKTAGCLSGPGHQTVFEAGGRLQMVFHAWAATSSCRFADKGRYMYVAPLQWRDGAPVIAPARSDEAVKPSRTGSIDPAYPPKRKRTPSDTVASS